ncbi:hypothetical protein Pmani_037005 [Petrolisthes manimaculis]|uniref:Transmembrane protein n=1 Tax=Petrolisthes manimaculis TaxID=1843537 RepID=A0AAE1NJ28_9EUCA|nr:hypothetical protein Pmani_037005 [Petrolisthes manimaculis]
MRDKGCSSLFLTWILVAVAVVVVGVVAQEEQIELPIPVNEEQQEQHIPVNEEQQLKKVVRTTGIVKSTVEKKDNNNNNKTISADGTVENKNNNDAVVFTASTQALSPSQSKQPGRFLPGITSTTGTVFAFVTSTVFFSCLSVGPMGNACMGRRRRRSLSRNIKVDPDKLRELSLDSSQQDGLPNTGDPGQERDNIDDTDNNPGQQRDNIDDTDNNTRLLGFNMEGSTVNPRWPSMLVVAVLTILAVMTSATEQQHHNNNNNNPTTTPTSPQYTSDQLVPGSIVPMPVKSGTRGIEKIEGRFFGASSTTTITDVAIMTSTVFFSCLNDPQPDAVCGGRRRKRKMNLDLVRGVDG